MIKNREFNRRKQSQDQYMKVHKDREMVEDVDAAENIFTKKRKVRRAAHT